MNRTSLYCYLLFPLLAVLASLSCSLRPVGAPDHPPQKKLSLENEIIVDGADAGKPPEQFASSAEAAPAPETSSSTSEKPHNKTAKACQGGDLDACEKIAREFLVSKVLPEKSKEYWMSAEFLFQSTCKNECLECCEEYAKFEESHALFNRCRKGKEHQADCVRAAEILFDLSWGPEYEAKALEAVRQAVGNDYSYRYHPLTAACRACKMGQKTLCRLSKYAQALYECASSRCAGQAHQSTCVPEPTKGKGYQWPMCKITADFLLYGCGTEPDLDKAARLYWELCRPDGAQSGDCVGYSDFYKELDVVREPDPEEFVPEDPTWNEPGFLYDRSERCLSTSRGTATSADGRFKLHLREKIKSEKRKRYFDEDTGEEVEEVVERIISSLWFEERRVGQKRTRRPRIPIFAGQPAAKKFDRYCFVDEPDQEQLERNIAKWRELVDLKGYHLRELIKIPIMQWDEFNGDEGDRFVALITWGVRGKARFVVRERGPGAVRFVKDLPDYIDDKTLKKNDDCRRAHLHMLTSAHVDPYTGEIKAHIWYQTGPCWCNNDPYHYVVGKLKGFPNAGDREYLKKLDELVERKRLHEKEKERLKTLPIQKGEVKLDNNGVYYRKQDLSLAKLYDKNSSRSACPSGYRFPSKDEFVQISGIECEEIVVKPGTEYEYVGEKCVMNEKEHEKPSCQKYWVWREIHGAPCVAKINKTNLVEFHCFDWREHQEDLKKRRAGVICVREGPWNNGTVSN